MDSTFNEQYLQRLWLIVMPSAVPPLNEYTAFLWLSNPEEDIRYAIAQTAEKMHRNVRSKLPIEPTDAERYAASIIANRAAWRKEKARRTAEYAKRAADNALKKLGGTSILAKDSAGKVWQIPGPRERRAGTSGATNA